jgi:hypothetical protein
VPSASSIKEQKNQTEATQNLKIISNKALYWICFGLKCQ